MSITAVGIKNSILNKISSLSDEDRTVSLTVHSAWADGITEYIIANLTVSGAYIGVTNTVPPVTDPLNGTYSWGISSFVLTGAQVLAAVSGNTTPSDSFSAWKTVLEDALKAISFVGVDQGGMVTTSPGLVLSSFVFNITQGDLSSAANNEEVITIIANKMYESLINTSVSGVTSAGVSVTPGTGVVTYLMLS